jgi:hypothetical protein
VSPTTGLDGSEKRNILFLPGLELLPLGRPTRSQPFFFNLYSGGGVQFGPLGTADTNRPIMPAPSDYDDGEIGGMIGRGN